MSHGFIPTVLGYLSVLVMLALATAASLEWVSSDLAIAGVFFCVFATVLGFFVTTILEEFKR